MPIASVAALLQMLDQYGLVTPAERSQIVQLARTGPQDPRAFARELVQRGWLTPYQINQLFQDNGSSLQLGSYTLIERLGSGGMGSVFKARHQKLGRVVALKVIHRDKLSSRTAVKRFRREIQVVAHLDHPNIVHAYDADEVNGAYLLAMEYLEGTDLGKLVKERGPLPVRDACDYVRQAALALQHAHEKGLVHRDVKPGNLMLQTGGSSDGSAGTVKLLDLGLALLQQPLLDVGTSGPLTVAGKVVGTVDFLAPEQARDASSVDIRADLYGLGCTFYYLLTGRAPFEGGTATNKLLKHALEEPEPVERRRPDVPRPVAAVVRRLMAKDPEDRYQTPAALAAVLDDVLQGRPARGPADDEPQGFPLAVPLTAAPRKAGSSRRRRWLWLNLVGLGVLLLMLGVLAAVLYRVTGGPDAGTAKDDNRPSAAEREAQAELDRLRQQHRDGLADRSDIRKELVAFRWRHPGLPQTLQAMALLRELPSPWDGLDAANIRPAQDFPGRPPELVAVVPGPVAVAQAVPEGAGVLTAHGAVVTYRDLVKGTVAAAFKGVRGPVRTIALAPDGRHALLGGAGKHLGLWDVTTGREVRKLDAHAGDVTTAAVSPDGRWGLSGGADNVVRLWSLADGTFFSLEGHTAAVTGAAFTPDGKLALTAGADKALRVWDLGIRRERKPHAEAPDRLTCLAVAPDGKRAYAGSARGVGRWSLGPLAPDGALPDYSGPVSSLAVTADGHYLAACHDGGWVGVWDPGAGRKVKEWKLPAALTVSWALDGRHLVIAGGAGAAGRLYVLRMP